MRVLELLGLIVVPLAAHYGIVREMRWRIFVPVLLALIGVLFYVDGDLPVWGVVWYNADLVAILVMQRILHRPELVDRRMEKIWATMSPVEPGKEKVERDLQALSGEPGMCWICLELDDDGDLLVAAKVNRRSVPGRFRIAGECPHCVLESLLASFTAVELVDQIEFYRTETSADQGCAAYVYFDRSAGTVRIDIAHSGRLAAEEAEGCTVHAVSM
ncbi:hypothetical protein OH805_37550 [Streptomyces sp. NBC_00879]|uniref:hypothetical protein n=1 Tax=Streptomyces sp. NBC_00879 TaxID=2975855 RepID=UPI00386C1AB8|nr:hypothetical protein OH805_37550 [Streptomyces sp. NBC_00879]